MAVYINDEMQFYTTQETQEDSASRELAKFLAFDLQTMGYAGEFPLTKCIPEQPLGRGSTSIVLEVNYGVEKYVAKISRNCGLLKVERVVLKYLKSKNVNLAVPIVVDETDNPDLYASFRLSNLSPSRTILEKNEEGLIFTEQASYQLPYVSFLTEVYERQYSSGIKLKHFSQLWEILKEVHRHGVCHRDVRIPNLAFKHNDSKQYDTYLLDWSSCKPFVLIPELYQIDEEYLRGCTSTASIKVLQRMNVNINNYICYPSDEAISFIYLAYQLKSPNKNLEVPKKPEHAIETWKAEKDNIL